MQMIPLHPDTRITLAPESPGVLTSYPVDDASSSLLTARAIMAADKSLEDCLNTLLLVEHVVMYPEQRTDDKGEVRDVVVTVLITMEGWRISTESPYIGNSVYKLVRHYRPLPWTGGLALVARKRRNRADTRDYYVLDLAEEES